MSRYILENNYKYADRCTCEVRWFNVHFTIYNIKEFVYSPLPIIF